MFKERTIPKYYVLEGKKAVPFPDCGADNKDRLLEWARRFQNDNRVVANDYLPDYWVSTVFLGFDHSFSFAPDAPPILFETMIFKKKKGKVDWSGVYQMRSSTWEEAEEVHKRALAMARAGRIEDDSESP